MSLVVITKPLLPPLVGVIGGSSRGNTRKHEDIQSAESAIRQTKVVIRSSALLYLYHTTLGYQNSIVLFSCFCMNRACSVARGLTTLIGCVQMEGRVCSLPVPASSSRSSSYQARWLNRWYASGLSNVRPHSSTSITGTQPSLATICCPSGLSAKSTKF